MRRALASRWHSNIPNTPNVIGSPTRPELPIFLCPAIRTATYHVPTSSSSARFAPQPRRASCRSTPWTVKTGRRHLHEQVNSSTDASSSPIPDSGESPVEPPADAPADTAADEAIVKALPRICRGCGALSQTSQPDQPGYFDVKRKSIRVAYFGPGGGRPMRSRIEDRIYEEVLGRLNTEELEKKGVDVQALALSLPPPPTPPSQPQGSMKKALCDRCHYLHHNNTAEPIYHPSVEAIYDTLQESPYKYNHVYHVLDAADFPMSLLPKLPELLNTPLRSKNRRSRIGRYFHDQKTEISFIITRADLLAPTLPQLNSIHPYLVEVLRDALDPYKEGIRLGKVQAVSARRSWWIKPITSEIWERGGGNWLVGKANVGKSQLFGDVFPKGRMNWDPPKHGITIQMNPKSYLAPPAKQEEVQDAYSLLPPLPEETQYPEMPLVSGLPGTTASPIRVPFGNGRGELIDLPGLERSTLEKHVQKKHHPSLLMQTRIVPEQMTVKPGQSLLLGGFIRITPREPAPVMLTYAFTPLEPHVCRTDKAISIQQQMGEVNVENIAVSGTQDTTKLAGSFKLKWDVTKKRTGPLTRRGDVGLDVERLPYRVLSIDILIEGVGWVEVTTQVRLKDLYAPRPRLSEEASNTSTPRVEKTAAQAELEAWAQNWKTEGKAEEEEEVARTQEMDEVVAEDDLNWPIVDVYSPEGRYIAFRRPMNGWLLNKPRVTAASKRSRPRKSMSGVKKRDKKLRREREAAAGAAAASF